jgi:hypothetical protein
MRRNWLIAAVVIGIAAIVIAAVVMRVTEEERLTTEEWADEVCTSLVDWRTSITSLADVSGEPITSDSLRDRLSDAEDATSDLVSQLRDLGPPDLEAGDELQQELDGATAELDASFEALKESADEAADAPVDEFLGELANLAAEFAALQAAIGQTVATLQSADVAEESQAELEQAFADSSSCQELRADDS